MESILYPDDLTEQEYALIKDQLPYFNRGRPAKYGCKHILKRQFRISPECD